MSTFVGTQTELNAMTITCQVRATASGSSSYIRRNGGTFKIQRSTTKPTTTTSLGDLYAQAAYSYTSSTTTQPNTTSASIGTSDNDIIQVQVVIGGTCSPINVTQLNFNTTGCTNAGTDLTKAKVYYTGLTSTYSPIGLFGSTNSPNGSFTVTGSQVLAAGTNYFWLVYDLNASGTAGNVVDAQCTSITMDNGVGAKVPTATNPAGTRTLTALTAYYSRGTGNWNDNTNWSYTSGGASCSCQPNGTGNVFISTGHTITLNASRTVDYLTIQSGATLQDDGSSTLTVSKDFTTISTGNFTETSAWTVSRNMSLAGTGASTTTKTLTIVGTATIGNGTTLTTNGTSSYSITIQGNLVLDGTLSSGSTGATIIMNGASTQTISNTVGLTGTLSGTGNLSFTTSAKTFNSLSSINIDPTVAITGAITVTNNGTVTMTGNLTGSVAGSTWVNAATGVLNTSGTIFSTGTLTATAVGNIVNYNSNSAQTVKTTTYSYLTISNGGTRTFQTAGTISISDLLTIQDAAIFDVSTNTLSGAGGLTMTGTAELKIAKTATTEPELSGAYTLTAGTVTLNQSGAATQVLNGTPSYYNVKLDGGNASSLFDLSSVTDISNNLTISNVGRLSANGIIGIAGNLIYSTSGTTTLGNDITVDGTTTISNGTFNVSSYYFTTGALVVGGGTYNAGSNTLEITDVNGWTRSSGTFTPSTSTVILSGTSAQTLGGSLTSSFYNLQINNAAGITLAANCTVTNVLTMTAGIITTSAYTLNITSTSTSAINGYSSSNYIVGNLLRNIAANGSYDFPVGSTTNYELANLNFNSQVGTTSVTASFSSTISGTTPNSSTCLINGTGIYTLLNGGIWTLTPNVEPSSGTIDVTLYERGQTNSATSANRYGVISRANSSSAWGFSGTHLNSTQSETGGTAIAKVSGVTALSDWGVGEGGNALPVQFASFSVEKENTSVSINWSTAAEFNDAYFAVQRSADGIEFEEIDRRIGAGTSALQTDYYVEDKDPLPGISYYRLLQVDKNGNFEYSSIRSVNFPVENTNVMIYPNPFSNSINVSFSSDESYTISIYNETGLEVMKADFSMNFTVNAEDFAPGIYFVRITNDKVENVLAKKFIKAK